MSDMSINPSGGSHFRPNLNAGGPSGKMKFSGGERKVTALKQGSGGVEVPTPTITSSDEQKKNMRRRTAKPLDPGTFKWHKGS